MELKGFIEESLTETQSVLLKVVDGLTPEELAWRPSLESNSIGFILWHTLRVEDIWIQRIAQRKQQVYEADGWYQKFGTEARDIGYNYSLEQLASFVVPSLDDLLAYGKSLREHTLKYLRALPVEKLDEQMSPNRPDTIGYMLRHIIIEFSEHIGQIAYLRGLQKGLDK